MKIPNAISICVSKIIQKKQFVKDILQSIENLSGRALLVGGSVRDLFLDLPIKDLDFEIYGLTLEQLQEILEKFGRVSLIGKSFGVLRLHGLDVDWSLPRKDSSGRHPVVQYDSNMNYEESFARRDLTINAMGIDMQTFELIDPFGGMNDLKSKILRSPDLYFFAQDPLRLLRVMQFVARFQMNVDEKLSQLCREMDMSQVSQERIEQEFRKLFLQAQRPSIGLLWLKKIGKFDEFLPRVTVVELLCEKLDNAAVDLYQNDRQKIVIMWALIVACVEFSRIDRSFRQISFLEKKPYIQYLRSINYDNTIINQVVACVVYGKNVDQVLSSIQLKWLAVWLAPEISIRTLSKFITLYHGQRLGESLCSAAENIAVADKPEEPILTGKNFLDVAQGSTLGILVKKAYQIQIDQEIVDPFLLKNKTMESYKN